jgi:hypothetical protein
VGGKESSAAPGAGSAFDFSQVLSIADALPMPIALIDLDGYYRFCN